MNEMPNIYYPQSISISKQWDRVGKIYCQWIGNESEEQEPAFFYHYRGLKFSWKQGINTYAGATRAPCSSDNPTTLVIDRRMRNAVQRIGIPK